jgi:hypothetical protein
LVPTTSDSAALGVIGFMNAALGFLADFFAVFLAISTPSMCRDPPDETARECPQRSTSARIFMGKTPDRVRALLNFPSEAPYARTCVDGCCLGDIRIGGRRMQSGTGGARRVAARRVVIAAALARL